MLMVGVARVLRHHQKKLHPPPSELLLLSCHTMLALCAPLPQDLQTQDPYGAIQCGKVWWYSNISQAFHTFYQLMLSFKHCVSIKQHN